MTHTDSGTNQNQIQKSLVPMLRTWTHSIGWTVLLSAALAILFALLCDGCSSLH
jgi:inner membrane protein involved in colicin E2 resistance